MINLIFRPQALLITIPLLTLVVSNHADAEIYKWRDNRGVTQYSDRPPVDSFSKITRNELVNSLQTKDLCVDGPIKKNVASTVASTKDYSGFFTNFIKTKNVAAAPAKNTVSAFAANKNNVTILGFSKNPTKPIQVVTAPPKTTPPVTKPTKPDVTTPPTTALPKPDVTTPPITTNPSTPPNIVQTGLMPAVDISKNIASVLGYSDLRIRPAQFFPGDAVEKGDGDGQFRIDCAVSHMSNDDPILYPNQQGAAHHHTFFGNTSVNYKSNLMTLSTTGNSTCRGGIANRSAYWVPSMIDTKTNKPLVPVSALWYYKTGYSVPNTSIKTIPKGLRIIAGNMKGKNASEARKIGYNCFKEGQPSTESTNIPSCPVGWQIVTHVIFPQCWDAKNLDSPDHISHMAYPSGGSCPASHPYGIPGLALNIKYNVTTTDGTKNWRLSSDNYATNGYNAGYSGHGDVVFGWDEKVITGIVKNCLNAGMDCGNHKLGDGKVIYGENVSWQ